MSTAEPLIPSQEPQSRLTVPSFDVPPLACDTHAHISVSGHWSACLNSAAAEIGHTCLGQA